MPKLDRRELDRLARSVPDARAIGDDQIAPPSSSPSADPADPMGKMLFNILATFAEFEVDLLRMRTREGMAVARAKGKLRGKQPKLSARQQRELARMAGIGEYTIADLAEVFTVSRAIVYRTLQRSPAAGHLTPSEQPQGFPISTARALPLVPVRYRSPSWDGLAGAGQVRGRDRRSARTVPSGGCRGLQSRAIVDALLPCPDQSDTSIDPD